MIAVTVVLGVLLVVPLLIPVRTFLDKAEQIATQKSGVPVTLNAGYLQLLPTPRLIVQGISVGHQQELRVESLTMIPELSTLFKNATAIDIRVNKPTFKQAAFSMLKQIAESSHGGDQSSHVVTVRHIELRGIQLDKEVTNLPVLDMGIDLSDNSVLQSAWLTSADDTLNVNIKPEGTGYAILLTVNRMTLPAAVPLLIDQATVNMMLNDSVLDIAHIEMALYGGSLKGDARVSWDKSWRATGKLQLDNLSLSEPSRLVSPAVYLSGNLSGSARFSAAANTASALADHLIASVRFDVKQGVLHGLDLAALANLLTSQTKGGNTQFDIFSGALTVRGRHYALNDINMRSGLLTATGQVKVSPDNTLDGLIEVALQKGVSLVEVPLQVSGTVDTPSVMPTKAAMAGAVAGTAILGPGLGTSLGLKAGGAIDKVKGLFQRD